MAEKIHIMAIGAHVIDAELFCGKKAAGVFCELQRKKTTRLT